ncbi:MAG TPA: SDR family NAD(P)-dependent oxidoreductase [Caulobacteraceae bacterium]
MTDLPYLAPGRTAVITGGADGIGRAAGLKFAAMGLNVVLADRNAQALEAAEEAVKAATREGASAISVTMDVSDFHQVTALKTEAFQRFGDVAVLMNNAGVGRGGSALENHEGWMRILSVNLIGVLNGVQAFGPEMVAQGRPATIINTGSKQGITTPPGDTAYNVSKAGVKVLTEGLAHTLRNTPGCQVSAHLLVPGFTFTGLTRPGVGEKPAGAWSAAQVIDFALERMSAGDFYVICPDNEVTREMDNARMEWAAQDIVQNRPPLSRWHPDWKDAFADFLSHRT